MRSSKESAIELMKRWFHERFEDPSQSLFLERRGSGFEFVWGGPIKARDVLFEEFSEKYESGWIEELISDLESHCREWSPVPEHEDGEWTQSYIDTFQSSLRSISEELAVIEKHPRPGFILALLFAHTITAMEAYLADVIRNALKQEKYLREFLRNDPEMKEQKFSMSEVYEKFEKRHSIVADRISRVVFHRLDLVRKIYKSTLSVEFPSEIGDVIKGIEMRHDIVHRNCRRKNGSAFEVKSDDVKSIAQSVKNLVEYVNGQLPEGVGFGG